MPDTNLIIPRLLTLKMERLIQQSFGSTTIEQFELHSFRSSGAPEDLSDHVGAGGKVQFDIGLACAFHVCQDGLTEMPA